MIHKTFAGKGFEAKGKTVMANCPGTFPQFPKIKFYPHKKSMYVCTTSRILFPTGHTFVPYIIAQIYCLNALHDLPLIHFMLGRLFLPKGFVQYLKL